LVVVFGINLLIRFSLLVFDGVLNAKLRRRLQEAIFRRILFGEWSCTRDSRVGDLVGTNTQEALLISKYLSSAISTVYFALSSLVMIIMSAITSLKVTFFLGLIALPFIFLMKKTFSIQAGLSKESALLRNNFSADITDRFNGLLQIHVDNNYGYHIEQGIRSQSRLTRLDVLIAYCQSVIGIFNLLLPFFVLIGFSLWIYFLGNTYKPNFPLIASVGFLGMKAVSQLNGMVASLGNLSRLSGSLFPVLRLLAIASINKRTLIQEEIIGIKLNRISYKYGIHKALNNINLRITKGSPLLLTGRSGKGKTTIGNLIAGLFYPSSGELMYEGASGKSYLSSKYRAKIGFVTQDIYLFQGTLRSNLTGNRKYADKEIWSALKQVDIFNFVKKIGGLDTSTLEAGRSLSGGQRRRLGIARALLSGCDILIFDEILSGLDKKNKIAITKLINELSYKKILIMISHDEILLNKKFTYNIK
jgi:ABC-type transport system involved in cytochrome bd biosynthesis fused ATPase/permease subunit